MTISFHRLTVPSYAGGLPSGYDYLNNATSGTPANAAGILTGGPNAGSYMVGFGDDGTSSNANRPHSALGANTDYLDDLFHQDLAVPTASSLITSAGDTIFVTPSSPNAFVGVAGTPNTPAGIASFVKLLDQNGNEIEVNGAIVQVASISGATVGTGFASGAVTFTFSIAVPTGTIYRVWYAIRSNLANLPVDALTNITIRTTQELPAAFEDFQKQISTFSGLNVTSLVATLIQTPDGSRLSKSSTLDLSVDPDGTNGGTHTFTFWSAKSTGSPKSMAVITDNSLYTGLNGYFGLLPSYAHLFGGTWLVSDTNASSQFPSAPYNSQIKMTAGSAHAANVQKWEKTITSTDVSNGVAIDVMSHINARWAVTCGDGTNSFGDFTGPNAINLALTYATNHSIAVGHLLVKAGTYNCSTSITPPTGSTFIIEGDGGVTLNSQQSGAALFDMAGGANRASLDLRNLTIAYSSGSCRIAVDFSVGSLSMRGVSITGMDLTASQPALSTIFQSNHCFYAKDCYIKANTNVLSVTTANTIGSGSTYGDTVNGIIFEDCQLFGANDNPLFQVLSGNLGGVSSVSGIKFIRCYITLGFATTFGSSMTGNSGVFAVNLVGQSTNGSPTTTIYGTTAFPDMLFVRDIAWIDCHVQAVANAGSNQSDVLLHLVPYTYGQSTPAVFAAIGSVTIKGGRWEVGDVNNSGNHQKYSPFFVAARNVVMEDVTFRGSNAGNGTPTLDIMNALMGNGVTTVWTDSGSSTVGSAKIWGAFTVAPGAAQVYDVVPSVIGASNGGSYPVGPGCRMHNVVFENLCRDGGTGDLLLRPAPANNDVDGIVLTNYIDTNTGIGAPPFRVWLYGGGSTSKSYGRISGIHILGMNSASGHTWIDATGASSEHEGFFRITPGSHMHIYDCVVAGFQVNSAVPTTVGFVLTLPPTTGTSALYGTTGLRMEECTSSGIRAGFVVTTNSSAHPKVVARWVHCSASGGNEGFLVSPGQINAGNEIHIIGCTATTNTITGALIEGSWGTSDLLKIMNSNFFGNTGTHDVEYQPALEPGGVFMGNDAATVYCQPVSGSIGGVTPMRGFETGETTSGYTSRAFVNGNNMILNNAILNT